MEKLSKSKSAATSLHKINHKISKRSSESSKRQRSHENSTKKTSDKKSVPKITKEIQKKHRSSLRKKMIPDGTKLFYKSKGKILKTGYTDGDDIFCNCCEEVFTPTKFEVHAGKTKSKNPYQNLYLEEGMSVNEYASSLKLNGKERAEKNDLLCMVCQKSGDLLSCEECPRSFHQDCVSNSLTALKKQVCKECQRTLLTEPNVKDGRVSGMDPNEQITKHSITIDGSCDLIACVLCRSSEFSSVGFSDLTSIVCDQCEKEYHVGCLKNKRNIVLKELPLGNWFCNNDCERLHFKLQLLVEFGQLMIKDPYWKLVKGSDAESLVNADFRWFVIKGKDASEQNIPLLMQAVDILHERFNPIIDSETGEDFIPAMAYGQQMGPSNFSGVHTVLLTRGPTVITAGMFRAFGRKFAELPVVATREAYQGKGYFRLFMECFTSLLSYCYIKRLVIPAANDAKAMWVQKFEFSEVPPKRLARWRQTQTSMVAFHGTTLLQKKIKKWAKSRIMY